MCTRKGKNDMKRMKVAASDIDGTLALKGGNLMPLTKAGLWAI